MKKGKEGWLRIFTFSVHVYQEIHSSIPTLSRFRRLNYGLEDVGFRNQCTMFSFAFPPHPPLVGSIKCILYEPLQRKYSLDLLSKTRCTVFRLVNSCYLFFFFFFDFLFLHLLFRHRSVSCVYRLRQKSRIKLSFYRCYTYTYMLHLLCAQDKRFGSMSTRANVILVE